MKLYCITLSILIRSQALGDLMAKAMVDWRDTRVYKFANATEREEFAERIERINREMREELGVGVDIFAVSNRVTEHDCAADEAVQDALNRFAHRHLVFEGMMR